MELGLQETGFTCDDCRWKIERGECPWDFDYDEKHPYAEDCCDFRNVGVPESEFKEGLMKQIRIDESQTVAEFIETLKQFPQELPIRINHTPGTEIFVSEEFYDGDCANPKCPVIRAVIVV